MARYAIVGALAFALDFSLLYALTEWWGIYYLLSASLAFAAGLLLNYLLSIHWVFGFRSCRRSSIEFTVFLGVGLGGVILTDFLLFVLVPFFEGNYLKAKVITVIFVSFWNFYLRKRFLFKQKADSGWLLKNDGAKRAAPLLKD